MDYDTSYLPVALFLPLMALLGIAACIVAMIFFLRRRRRARQDGTPRPASRREGFESRQHR